MLSILTRISLTLTVVHDCSIIVVSGLVEQNSRKNTFTMNWTDTELSDDTLAKLMKSSNWIMEK